MTLSKVCIENMADAENCDSSEDKINEDNSILKEEDSTIDDTYLNDEPSLSLEGSVVASPSIESFSTLPEGESSLSLADGASDLIVRVDSPQKQAELLETYVTFRISTKTSREGYDAPGYSVRRRYNDFVWLRQHLVQAYPTHFVPALPLKHSLIGQFDRYGREFVTARMAALQVFLNRIVGHPILSFAPCFKCFLTATTEEFLDLRRLTTGGILSKVSDSWKSLSTLHIETRRPAELTKFYDYLGDLSEKLNSFCRITQRIHREREGQARELSELRPALRAWAGSDVDLTSQLTGVANAVEKCESGLHSILLENNNLLVTQPLKEYILYVDAVKETLDRRDELEVELLYRKEILEKKRQELVAQQEGAETGGLRAWVKTFESKEDRVLKLEQAVSQANSSLEESKDRLECANENIRADMSRWLEEKQSDIKGILLAFADQNISFYQQCGQAWDEVLSDMSDPSSLTAVSHAPS